MSGINDSPLIFERNTENPAAGEAPPSTLSEELYRARPVDLPDLPEPRVVRHYHRLSRESFGTDTGPYLLGSCTMKYNPRLSEQLAALPGYTETHPRQPAGQKRGWLEMLGELHDRLARLNGLPAVSLLPAAGAHGEWVALRTIGDYFRDQGEQRTEVIVPDSAHGTNPASAAVAGFDVVEVDSNERGRVDLDDLRATCNSQTAALMLTNPNTLGLFEEDILEIADIVHSAGARLYYDGANLNPLAGRLPPGDMGFDVVHLNLHKTFGTPHGGGGPGAGPVAFSEELAPYRPLPRLTKREGEWMLGEEAEKSIGRIRSFAPNLTVLVRALVYLQRMGEEGVAQAARDSVLTANYLANRLPAEFQPVYPLPCKHEFVVSCADLPVDASDVAKRLIDFEIHPPTVYFPLVVEEALMIEPTESLSLRELDRVVEAFQQILEEAKEDPDQFKNYPETTRISRPDETTAARRPVLNHPVET